MQSWAAWDVHNQASKQKHERQNEFYQQLWKASTALHCGCLVVNMHIKYHHFNHSAVFHMRSVDFLLWQYKRKFHIKQFRVNSSQYFRRCSWKPKWRGTEDEEGKWQPLEKNKPVYFKILPLYKHSWLLNWIQSFPLTFVRLVFVWLDWQNKHSAN